MQDFFAGILDELKVFNWLEVTAVISALIYVFLAARGNKWCFLFGLISSAIYVYITFKLNFYFDVLINLYYIVMSYFGYISWSTEKDNGTLQISTTPKNQLKLYVIIGVILTVILAFIAEYFSNAQLAYLDAFTTIFAIIATLLVVKKQLENWLIWMVVDLVASGMYFYKELYFTALLFIIYTIIAIVGYFKWKKLLQIN